MKHTYSGSALILLIILWLLLTVCTAAGQDNDRPIILDKLGIPEEPVYYDLSPHIEGTMPGFHFAVDFEELPQPLKPTRGTITLTKGPGFTQPFEVSGQRLRLDVQERKVKWLSEPIVTTPCPLEVGDVFTIPIELVILASGQAGFTLGWADITRTIGCGTVVWSVSLDGELEFLGSNVSHGGRASGARHVTFFDQDSVRINHSTKGEVGINMFAGYCKIEPPFKIGEPSSVCFNIEMVESHADGLDLEISFGHMLVSDFPRPIKGPVYAGGTFELCMTVVPLPVRELHDISLSVYDEQGSPNKEVISITSLFADDGTLRYISNSGLDFVEQDSTLLPKSFPSGTKATCGSHWIKRE